MQAQIESITSTTTTVPFDLIRSALGLYVPQDRGAALAHSNTQDAITVRLFVSARRRCAAHAFEGLLLPVFVRLAASE